MSQPGEGRGSSQDPGLRPQRLHLRVVNTIIPTAAAFVRTEAASGIVLLAALAIGLAWANSPWSDSYFDLWQSDFTLRTGGRELDTTLAHVVNEGLMTLFFFVVGLEIKRELVEGELVQPRQAMLPVAAAAGGMAGPALIYAAFNLRSEGAEGWGVPMATDIAMVAGLLAVLGPRVPAGLKVFLLALAIVDDIGGIVVIALFYTSDLSASALAGAGVLLAALIVLRLVGARWWPAYAALGGAFWAAVLASGVHATIAGVALAMLTSAGTKEDPGESALDRLETILHPWTSFVVVPLFALANSGVEITGTAVDAAVTGGVAPGIFFGLVVGKPLGITLTTLAARWAGLASLPPGVHWSQVAGAGALAGVGFTVSLFIAGLAFNGEPPADDARLGILAASLVASVAGYAWLRIVAGERANSPRDGRRTRAA